MPLLFLVVNLEYYIIWSILALSDLLILSITTVFFRLTAITPVTPAPILFPATRPVLTVKKSGMTVGNGLTLRALPTYKELLPIVALTPPHIATIMPTLPNLELLPPLHALVILREKWHLCGTASAT